MDINITLENATLTEGHNGICSRMGEPIEPPCASELYFDSFVADGITYEVTEQQYEQLCNLIADILEQPMVGDIE